jgi:osmotically-inducible protein OsmY
MKEDSYVAGQVERALAEDPRTHELGVRVEVAGDAVILRGEVGGEERRRLVGEVAAAEVRELTVRNEVTVTEVLPPGEATS